MVHQFLLGLDSRHVEHVVGHLGTGECASSTECVTGLCRNRLTSLSTPLSSVAENSMRCPPAGVAARIRVTPGKKSEVSHVIGLVDDGDLDRVEVDDALPHQVFQPTWAGYDDVDAGTQRRNLTVLRDAAEDGGDLELVGGCQRFEGRGDLGRQLTGRRQDQTSRSTRRCMAASRVTIGMENASVLPLPVLPRPNTSRPARVSGRVFS